MDKPSNEKLPRHIAIIMDGNGRWARKKRLPRINGHQRGIEVVKDTVEFSRELGIGYLTLYAFSKENWNRPAAEVGMLMMLLERHLKKEAEDLVKNNIRFRAIGNIKDLPAGVRSVIQGVEERTAQNKGMSLQLALSYGARGEIVEASKNIAREVKEGRLSIDEINEERFRGFLYTKGIPDPDLLIRTSGERRLSNFLLWQVAYTEFYVTDVLWPDFTREDLMLAINDFQTRERRFGLTREQLTGVLG